MCVFPVSLAEWQTQVGVSKPCGFIRTSRKGKNERRGEETQGENWERRPETERDRSEGNVKRAGWYIQPGGVYLRTSKIGQVVKPLSEYRTGADSPWVGALFTLQYKTYIFYLFFPTIILRNSCKTLITFVIKLCFVKLVLFFFNYFWKIKMSKLKQNKLRKFVRLSRILFTLRIVCTTGSSWNFHGGV